MQINLMLILIFMALVGLIIPTKAQDAGILYPENNASTRYIVEFRARAGVPGHAFVLVGRELDNGLRAFEAIAGFYPEGSDGALRSVKNVAFGPGEVTSTFSDLQSDVSFAVPIEPENIGAITEAIIAFDDQDYSLLANNCVSMIKAVAEQVGINTSAVAAAPFFAVQELSQRYHRSLADSPVYRLPEVPSVGEDPGLGGRNHSRPGGGSLLSPQDDEDGLPTNCTRTAKGWTCVPIFAE